MTLDKIVEIFEIKEKEKFINTEDFIRKAKKLFIGRSIYKLFDN